MAISLTQTSALNLTLEGSIGSFRVSNNDGIKKSLEVKYFLTHVGLDFESGASSSVLSHIAPVRELFETGTLEFDEIMQRDLDDSRVSSELIPYLLDAGNRDLVKLFPPIIVVVLPTKGNENKPGEKYPRVTRPEPKFENNNAYKTSIIRSGNIGQEVFEFSQPEQDGRLLDHDLARLKLNTSRTKLVIVDGQHRAMALLALYRNLKQEWSDSRRAPFKDYYEEWTPDYIQQFKLDKLSMPVMFCTFPELDEDYDEDYDLKKASRAIFLALNKNAKKVSDSRNKLLDDNDLIALLLRKTLSEIKSKDLLSPYSLRIFNVELDQTHDKMKIDSPIAVTGVNHIYYLIEHLLLNNPDRDVNGIKPRKGRFSTRIDLNDYNTMNRLDGRNELGADDANNTTRSSFSTDSGRALSDKFFERFGKVIVDTFERFKPFKIHCRSSLWLEAHIKEANPRISPILFDGQGIYEVFNAHRKNLKDKYERNDFGANRTQILEIISRLDVQAKNIQNFINDFNQNRAENFISEISDKSQLNNSEGAIAEPIANFISQKLYSNVLTTVAFQTALIATLIGEIEAEFGFEYWTNGAVNFDEEFSNYLTNIEKLLSPRTLSQFKTLADVFVGQIEGAPSDWKVINTPHTFRQVVHPDEMQSDQWPKYKYLFLELWKPLNSSLSTRVDTQRLLSRQQVFKSLLEKKRDEWLRQNQKLEDQMTPANHSHVQSEAEEIYKKLLNNLGWPVASLNKAFFNNLLEADLEETSQESEFESTDEN